MRIFVTAGNTQTPIDRVRCITNIFSGRTGAAIAREALRRDHDVTLATSHPETVGDLPGTTLRWQLLTYRTFDDLATLMAQHITQAMPDAIVHCAAVSDFRVAGIYAPSATTHFDESDGAWHAGNGAIPLLEDRAAGKVKSTEPELWLRLTRAPKLVDQIRGPWGFRGILVKFKLEVGITETELLQVAEKSRQHSGADWMVANTLEGASAWALVGNEAGYRKISRDDLPAAMIDLL